MDAIVHCFECVLLRVQGWGEGCKAQVVRRDRNQVERVAVKDLVREKRGKGGGIRKGGSDMKRGSI